MSKDIIPTKNGQHILKVLDESPTETPLNYQCEAEEKGKCPSQDSPDRNCDDCDFAVYSLWKVLMNGQRNGYKSNVNTVMAYPNSHALGININKGDRRLSVEINGHNEPDKRVTGFAVKILNS